MGIPTFFRAIIEKYNNTHFWDQNLNVDIFCIDFNAFVYDSIHQVSKEITIGEMDKMTTSKFETRLMRRVAENLKHLIVDIVKPQKLVYIAMDGVPPRAKSVQQRWRRHKSVIRNNYIEELCKKYDCPPKYSWDQTNISPGTKFMKKLSDFLQTKITDGYFCWDENPDLTIIYSDTSVPGEGEHKFMPQVKEIFDDDDTSIVIISPDADLIVLALTSHKKKIYIIKQVAGLDNEIIQNAYGNQEYFYLDVDKYKIGFIEEISKDYDGKIDEDKYVQDYVFLTFLSGNDFVIAPSYLKIKMGMGQKMGLDLVLDKYKALLEKHDEYLINYDQGNDNLPQVNQTFFRDIIREIAQNEQSYYKKIQQNRDRVRKQYPNSRVENKYQNMDPYDADIARFEHIEYYSQYHPLYAEMNPLFNSINYYDDIIVWRPKFYEQFFEITIDKSDDKGEEKFEENVTRICATYLEAIMFNTIYYFHGVPSWTWHYPYDSAPLYTDFIKYLDSLTPEQWSSISFKLDKPATPFELLMTILPKWNAELVPTVLSKYMTSNDSEIADSYVGPNDLRLNVLYGTKYVYSEPILPEIDAAKIHQIYNKEKSKLSKTDKDRNKLKKKPDVYQCKK